MATTIVFLVRHAKAADRFDWTGGDRDRPLIDKGRKQAERLAAALRREQPVLVAAGVPLVVGGSSVIVALGAIFLVASVTPMSIFVLNLATLLGLAGTTPEKVRVRAEGHSLLRLDRATRPGRVGPLGPEVGGVVQHPRDRPAHVVPDDQADDVRDDEPQEGDQPDGDHDHGRDQGHDGHAQGHDLGPGDHDRQRHHGRRRAPLRRPSTHLRRPH